MKTHHIFEQVPRAFRFYSIAGTNFDGIWLPVPVYWLLHGLRVVRLAYWRWKLRKR